MPPEFIQGAVDIVGRGHGEPGTGFESLGQVPGVGQCVQRHLHQGPGEVLAKQP